MIWLVMIVCGLLTLSMRFVMFSDLAPRQLPGWPVSYTHLTLPTSPKV